VQVVQAVAVQLFHNDNNNDNNDNNDDNNDNNINNNNNNSNNNNNNININCSCRARCPSNTGLNALYKYRDTPRFYRHNDIH
ncbi:MAG: hypothetical protein KAH03_08575, partial [Cocleimonas sp.]|nr:hypothetical protein [Cocleimonas sp.]